MIALACRIAFASALASAHGQHLAVSVQVLEASNNDGASAPQSRAARDLASTLDYKSYRTLREEKRNLALAEHMVFTLPNGATVDVEPVSIEPKKPRVRLRVSIAQGGQRLDTEYTVRDGGTVFVSAGASSLQPSQAGTAPGSVLVLAIVPKLN